MCTRTFANIRVLQKSVIRKKYGVIGEQDDLF